MTRDKQELDTVLQNVLVILEQLNKEKKKGDPFANASEPHEQEDDDDDDEQEQISSLQRNIAKLREWGRDCEFCKKIMCSISFNKIAAIELELDLNKGPIFLQMSISIFATLSNIILGNRSLLADMNDTLDLLIKKALTVISVINAQKSYQENLIDSILAPVRFIYLICVDKTTISQISESNLTKILKMIETQLQLICKAQLLQQQQQRQQAEEQAQSASHESVVQQNSLIVIDILKIGYSLLNYDPKYVTSKCTDSAISLATLNICGEETIVLQLANYLSFVPFDNLKYYERQLTQICCDDDNQMLINLLRDYVEEEALSEIVTLLNFFNHIALLSEFLYTQTSKTLFEKLRKAFMPNDDNHNVPPIYTSLMKILLQYNNSATQGIGFAFGAGEGVDGGPGEGRGGPGGGRKGSADGINKTMVKSLGLDLYFKLMGNNIENFINEVGLLLSMDMVKLKEGQNTQMFAQDDISHCKQTTGLYPAHYNVIEENKKLHESLPELTEEEKEEEWEKLMDTFDKMKKNGMIKLVENPLDAFNTNTNTNYTT